MTSLFPWILLFAVVQGANYSPTTEYLEEYMNNEYKMDPNLDCPGDRRCGCDSMYDYNEVTRSCELNRHATGVMFEKYNTQEKLKRQSDYVFSGAIAAAILFVTLAGACTVAACVYCCHMNRSDKTLKKQLKKMAEKSGKKLSLHSKRTQANTQDACPIIMEEPTIMCA